MARWFTLNLDIAAILPNASRVKGSARNLRKISRKIVASTFLSRKMLDRVKWPAISCTRKLRKNLACVRPAFKWFISAHSANVPYNFSGKPKVCDVTLHSGLKFTYDVTFVYYITELHKHEHWTSIMLNTLTSFIEVISRVSVLLSFFFQGMLGVLFSFFFLGGRNVAMLH